MMATNAPDIAERLPPHSAETEAALLGCVLLSPDCLSEAVGGLYGGPDSFYDLRHRSLYEQMVAMSEEQQAIDVVTLADWLKDKQLLQQVGGIAYFGSLGDVVPSAANASYYIEILNSHYARRRLIQTAAEAIEKAYAADGKPEELVDQFQGHVNAIGKSK